MGERINPDAIERTAIGPVTPEPAKDTFAHQPNVQREEALPGGDVAKEIDAFGNNVPGADTVNAAGDNPNGNGNSSGDMPPPTPDMIRQGQAANTMRSQEIARERELLAQQQAQFRADQQSFHQQQSEPAQAPTGQPLSLSEQLAKNAPGLRDSMNPEAIAVLDQIGLHNQQQMAPLVNEVQEMKTQLSQMDQQLQTANQQQNVRNLMAEGKELQDAYGAKTVQQFVPAIQQKMKDVPGLGVRDAFQLVAGPALQQAAVNQAAQKANEEQQRQQGASILERGASPSAAAVPPAQKDETVRQTAERLGLRLE